MQFVLPVVRWAIEQMGLAGAILGRGPRYLAVSLFCVLVNNLILIGFDKIGIHYGYSILASMAVLIPMGYVMQAKLTFSTSLNMRSLRRYALALIFNGPLSYLLLWFLHVLLRIDMIFAAPICTVILFLWNYLISNWAIRDRPSLFSRQKL
jgi:putative flippase GtrA